MKHPEYRVALRIPAPPEAVLAAIRATLDGTRRRGHPTRLKRGVLGLRGKVRGQRFTIFLEHSGEGGSQTHLVGMVLPSDDGGSDVRASVLNNHGVPTTVLVLLGIAGVFALLGIGVFAWTAAGVAAFTVVVATFRDATGLIEHDEAAFLRDWLNAALAPLGAVAVPVAGGVPSEDS